jgi:hypothetical protein
LNDELGSYIKKTPIGNVKLIPMVRFPDSVKSGNGTSFTLMFVTKEVKQGEELVQSIADSSSEVQSPEKIFSNNILFGEHATNNEVDYVEQIIERFEAFLLKLANNKDDRKKELVTQKMTDLRENFSGRD